MNVKEIIRPDVRETFFYGPIVSWKFNDSIVYVKARNRYCFRVSLTFESGAQTDYQRGGFLSKADALRQKKWQSHSYITKHSFLSTILQRNFLITGYIII